jgi:Tfp pilus assembly PilM family ATPase
MKPFYSRYFPTPSYLSMNSFGFDLSDTSLRYGQIIPTSSGLEVGRHGVCEIEPGNITLGKIIDSDPLVAVLKELKQKEHILYARVSLPQHATHLFTFTTTATLEHEIRNEILSRIQKDLPKEEREDRENVFDFKVIPKDEKTIVEVVMVARSLIESYTDVFIHAGITPLLFEPHAHSLARALILSSDTSTTLALDFRDTHTVVSIVQDGYVAFSTTLDIGADTLTELIAEHFSIVFEEARTKKHAYTSGSISGDTELAGVVLSGFALIRDELNKVLLRWRKSEKEVRAIEKIIVSGKDANNAGLVEYLQTNIGIKTEHANAWSNIYNKRITIPEISFGESLEFATVFGLCLADYYDYDTPNLLPKEYKKKVAQQYFVRFATTICTLLAFVGLCSTIFLFPAYFFSIAKSNQAEAALNDFNARNPQISGISLESQIHDSNTKLVLLSSSKPRYSLYDTVFNALFLHPIEGLSISQLFYTEKNSHMHTLEIYGHASDRRLVYTLKTNLEAQEISNGVKAAILDSLDGVGVDFTITVTLP